MKTTSVFSIALTLFLSASSVSQTIKSDDFNEFNLNRSIWTLTDPIGDATLLFTGTNTTDARLSLSVPAGTVHDIYTLGNQAPRIMQPAANTDFVIQSKFESSVTPAYQLQGMIVQASDTTFIRFDFYGDGTSTKLFVSYVNGASATDYANETVGLVGIQPLYLRITRAGDDWTPAYSLNGTTWTNLAAFTQVIAVSRVGLYVGNVDYGNGAPAHTMLVDYFQNNASPIVNEDGNSSVADTLKPFIYNIAAVTGPTYIQVNWKTDEAANGKVQYGLTTGYEMGFISHSNFITNHSLQINGLAGNTQYHYRIISADNDGRADTTADRTASTGDAFIISNVQVFKTSASATVTWLTNSPTSSKVRYGLTTAYTDSVSDTTKVISHLVNITGLNPSTLYHFNITSVDTIGNPVTKPDSTFTTIAATTLVGDEFNSGTLNGAVWTFDNTSGDGTQSMTGTQVRVGVPSGSRHDVWQDLNNAPRIRQNCNNADFQVTVKFDTGMSVGFQIQGLVIQQDTANFVRFDFNSDGAASNMFVATFVNNAPTIQLNQLVIDTLNSRPLYMRITRRGAEWQQEYSVNGTTWTSGVTFIHILNVSSVALFTGNSGSNPAFSSLVDYFRLPQPPVAPLTVNIKVLLEGPYVASGDSMKNDVRPLVPLAQPYNGAPWNYTGLEAVGIIPTNAVDWVLVELRTGTAAGTKVATRAGFVGRNGTVVDTSGSGAVTFVNVTAGNYYVVVHHRNHLSVMSANAVALNSSSALYDFTTASGQAFGTAPMKQLNTNIWGVYAGDANASRTISVNDANQVFGALNQATYNINDINVSGIVTAADANIVFGNLSKTSQVP